VFDAMELDGYPGCEKGVRPLVESSAERIFDIENVSGQ
jgi:hypothetical protein